MPPVISILGAGSWGTALALLAARNGGSILLWGHNPGHIADLQTQRENRRYLPGYAFPANLTICADLRQAVEVSDLLLICVPSHGYRALLLAIKPWLRPEQHIAWASKGFDAERGELLSEVTHQVLGEEARTAVLAGPTFAAEVAANLPTAVTIASNSDATSALLTRVLHNQYFRTYTSYDMVGVQVGGACKNVLAIAAGIADGLGFGANTRAALITRGLTEIMRIGLKLGGQADTFMGLTGLGDLILTCTDNQSRNRRFGLALGQGRPAHSAIAEIAQEIEGISAAREAYKLSLQHSVEMPITEQVYQVLFRDLPPEQAVNNLLSRNQRAESLKAAV